MRRRGTGLAVAALAAVLTAGCAGARSRSGAGFRLPLRYQANQVVHVAGTGQDDLDLLASVDARADRVDVVLFDAGLQIPLLRASAGPGGATTEELFVEGVPPGNGRRLAALIRTMNGLDFAPGDAGALDATGDGWRFTASELAGDPGCRFPRRIHVEHRYGGPRVDVETTDVACGDHDPGR